MNNFRRILLLLLLGVSFPSNAQDYKEFMRNATKEMETFKNQAQTNYTTFRDNARKEYEAFRDEANKEYADFMRQHWESHKVADAIPIPDCPDPPIPVVKDPNAYPLTEPEPAPEPAPAPKLEPTPAPKPEPTPAPKPEPAPAPKPEPAPAPKPEPTPAPKPEPAPAPKPEPAPAPKPEPAPAPKLSLYYYGTKCELSLSKEKPFALPQLNNQAIADAWGKMSNEKYYLVVDELEQLRQKLSLCDWGFVRLTECVASAIYSTQSPNEMRLMQIFFLTQAGYKVRMAQCGDKLLLLLPSELTIYSYKYIPMEDGKYYILNGSDNDGSVLLFDREFPGERVCSIEVTNAPHLTPIATPSRTLTSRKYPNLTTTIVVNRNIVDFYSDFPTSSAWDRYAKTPLNPFTQKVLYESLRKGLAGISSKKEATEMLLNFVQTAFDYKTDGAQFGYERPLFAEETLFYPYCDCEDRAILFSILVRDLLGLDVILLHYPNHLATAVCFNESVAGSYVNYNNKRYTVCDPTYIGASVGEAMPRLDSSKIQFVQIN